MYDSITHVYSFGKYGKETVINWAQTLPYRDHADNVLLIAHQGSGNMQQSKVSLGMYNRDVDSSASVQQMTGAVERPTSKPLSTNFAALMYRDGNDLKVVHSISGDGDEKAQAANLSLKVSIVYKYD